MDQAELGSRVGSRLGLLSLGKKHRAVVGSVGKKSQAGQQQPWVIKDHDSGLLWGWCRSTLLLSVMEQARMGCSLLSGGIRGIW